MSEIIIVLIILIFVCIIFICYMDYRIKALEAELYNMKMTLASFGGKLSSHIKDEYKSSKYEFLKNVYKSGKTHAKVYADTDSVISKDDSSKYPNCMKEYKEEK